MAEGRGILLLRHLGGLLRPDRKDEPTDSGLLEQFVARRDEAAFAALVRRHGPLVLGVCRRVLRDAHDAEDAFQATFLVLARKAESLARPERVGNWLHGVAVRVACAARARAARRQRREAVVRPVTPPDPTSAAEAADLRAVLDEEVGRLPELCRAAFVLCYLEGRTYAQAARALGWPVGSVSSRLAQARGLLRERLTRRGVVPSAALVAVVLDREALAAVLPAPLVAATARAGAAFAAGAAVEQAGGEAVRLGQAVLGGMALARVRATAALLLFLGVVGIGAALVFHSAGAAGERPPPTGKDAAPHAVGQKAPRVDRHGDPLPDGAVARLGTVRFRPGGAMAGVAFSPDGKAIAAGSYDGPIFLLDAVTGKELRRFSAPGASRGATVGFSPDGNLLASADLFGEMALWDVATGKQVQTFGEQRGTALAFSPDGKLLVSFHTPAVRTGRSPAPDPTVQLWDATTGKLRGRLKAHRDEVVSLAFSGDGKLLASASADKTVILWEMPAGREGKRFQTAEVPRCVALSPDGKSVASGNADGVIQRWDTATGKELRRITAHRLGTYGLAFAPDGKTLASVGQQLEPIELWDVATGKELHRLERRGEGMVWSLAFSPDGKRLAFGGDTVEVWDVVTGRDARGEAATRRPFAGQDGAVWCAACSPDGKAVAVAGSDPVIRIWDAARARELCRCAGHALPVLALAFRPDGKTLVSVSRDRTVRTWDAVTGAERARFTPNQEWIDHVAFSPGGKVLATTEGTPLIRLWDVASGQELGQLKGHQERIQCLAFSADGRRLASAGYAEVVRVWDVASKQEVRRIGAPKWIVNALAFAPDGRTLATAGWNDSVRLWEMATGLERAAAGRQEGSVYTLAFAPDGHTLAWAAYEDRLVRLWDVARGRELPPLRGHRARVPALAFSPNSRYLISGSDDTTALIWDRSRLPSVGRP